MPTPSATTGRRVGVLPTADVRRALRLSVADAFAYATMVGLGEVYFLADAIRLGATSLEQALVVTLPLLLGSAGPLLALRALVGGRSRRRFVVLSAAGQAAALLALAAVDLAGAASPGLLLACVAAYQVCGQAAGTLWNSWYGDLVPARLRGRYFGHRSRIAYAATFLGLIATGFLLHEVEPKSAAEAGGAGGVGFAAAYATAAVFRLVSTGLLAASPEPRFAGLPGAVRAVGFFRGVRGGRVRRLLLALAALNFAVYVGAPWFAPFMLEELDFGYLEYMAANLCIVGAKIASLPAWGRLVDRTGARSIWSFAVFALALLPLPWLWADGLAWVLVAQALSGVSWAAFEVSQLSLLLETAKSRLRPHVFAAQSVLVGVAQVAGSLCGAALAGPLSLRAVFAVTLGARLAVALVVPRTLPPLVGAPHVGRVDLLLRITGIRPAGGVAHRPIGVSGESPADGD